MIKKIKTINHLTIYKVSEKLKWMLNLIQDFSWIVKNILLKDYYVWIIIGDIN